MTLQRKTLRTIFGAATISALIVATTFSWYIYRYMYVEFNPGADPFRIERGSNLRDFARDLKARHLIQSEWPLLLWAMCWGKAHRIQAGEYAFPDPSSLVSILDQVVAGRVVTYSTTLIEGWTFDELRRRVEATQHLIADSIEMTEADILKRLGSTYLDPEGLFFPDTYFSVRGDTGFSLLRRAYNAMDKTLGEIWRERDPDTPLADSYAALILASIIEKESAVDEERRRISGVLSNRLRKKMPLQVDPTVIYGLGKSFDGDLTQEHLAMDTPYNTYTRRGLPPTPIANPGLKSLFAAVHPLKTTQLYFVSRGDGRHEFSDTLEEHLAAVRKYQLYRNKSRFKQP